MRGKGKGKGFGKGDKGKGKGGASGGGGAGTSTPALRGIDHKVKMLLLGIPGRFIDGKDFKAKWLEKYGTDLVLPYGVKLKAFLERSEAEGACELEMHAPQDVGAVEGGKGGGAAQVKAKDITYRICGVPWRVNQAYDAIEAAMQATKVKVLEKQFPEPELVDKLHKMCRDLLSSGADEGDDESIEYNNTGEGRLLVSVFTPIAHITGVPPPFVKVTLAMAPLAGGTVEAFVDDSNFQLRGASSASSENGSGDYTALKAACASFQALLDTFCRTQFLVAAEFPKQVDANAASDALQEKLGDQGKVSDLAAN